MIEVEVQELVARFPWLLSPNYESIPALRNLGQEYFTSGNRIDLVLRDRATGRPVLVEFKAVPFYRENIGQLIQYRTNVLLELAKDDSPLRAEFGEMLSSPVLCLLVPRCDNLARVACSLAGIDVYEFEAASRTLTNPSELLSLEDFDRELMNTGFPISKERNQKVDDIYKRMQRVISDLGSSSAWTDYRAPGGEYWPLLNHLFINKWMFRNNPVSLGVYEVILDKKRLGKCCIEFFSHDKTLLLKFVQRVSKSLDSVLGIGENEDIDDQNEYYYRYYLGTVNFSEKLEQVFGEVVKVYLSGIRELGIEV
jgi:hypothetical protein